MKLRSRRAHIHRLILAVPSIYFSLSIAHAQTASLATKTEHTVGVSLTGYEYKEPDVMTLKAAKIGFDYATTYAIESPWPNDRQRWFVGGQLRYATGKADYSSPSSGSLDNTPNWYYEIRGHLGKDFDRGSYVLAPFVGVGFRYLFNDLRGETSGGTNGYRRDSTYTTVSVGLGHKMHLAGQAQLLTTLEYIHLLNGKQKARFSDISPLRSDVSLNQNSGFGLRFSSMRRFADWSVGPTVEYWNIDRSDVGGTPPVVEPKNRTLEIGIKAALHF